MAGLVGKITVLLFAAFVACQAPLHPASVQDTCISLQNTFPSNTFFPENATYTALEENRWSRTSQLHPSCVILPTSAKDVSSILESLTDASVPFAIKSGGHNPIPGFNDNADGVTIDLSWINETTLSADRSNVRLGSGALWVDAYRTLNAQGVSFPGGRCSTTGVGGLTLAGGISFYSAKVGFVADNVVNFQVVLASGEVVDANEKENADLFLALKGGGSNFGIVTRFDIRTFEDDGRVFGGGVFSEATDETTERSLRGVYSFVRENAEDENAALATIFNYNATGRYILNSMVYGKSVEKPKIFETQLALPAVSNTMRNTSLVEVTEEVSTFLPVGYRNLFATVTIVNQLDAIKAAHRIADEVYDGVKDVPEMVWNFYFEPLPRVFTDHSQAAGGNVLGLDQARNDLMLLMLNPRWRHRKNDAEMERAAEKWVNSIRAQSSKLGAGADFLYMGYAAKFQDSLRSYGGGNIKLMKRVGNKYDPDGVFQRLMSGGFKIPE